MFFIQQFLWLALLATSFHGFVLGQTYSQDDIDSGKALQDMSKTAYDTALKRLEGTQSSCTKETVHVRKEWCVSYVRSHRIPNTEH